MHQKFHISLKLSGQQEVEDTCLFFQMHYIGYVALRNFSASN